MNAHEDAVHLLAILVHHRRIAADLARQALASGIDPGTWLVTHGHVGAEQWREWSETGGVDRPRLARYEIHELLGEGGTAHVWRARDRSTGEWVALKVLRPELCRESTAMERFVHESRLLVELRAANLVKGHRVARDGETVYCAMELLRGTSLQARLSASGRLGEVEALRIVAQVARALAALHARGLVHRDVKPGNIVLEPDGRAVLIDLGFALEGQGGGSATTVGTVHYIAPEQARGQAGIDVRADIYALGATLYHLVTGSLPFTGRTSEEVLAAQVLESLSGARIKSLGLSPQVHWLIEKMMAKDKSIRFQDPLELADEIDRQVRLLEGAKAVPAAEPARRRRRPLL